MFLSLIGLNNYMKRLIFVLLLCVTFWLPGYSQEAENIDAFGTVNCEDYLARMDTVIQTVAENPSATVYILVYEGKESIYDYKLKKTKLFSPPLGIAKPLSPPIS